MSGLTGKIITRMLAVSGITIVLLIVMLGSLITTTKLAAANNQIDSVRRVKGSVSISGQIGVLGCPTDPSISFIPANPQPGESVEFTGKISSTGGGGQITMTWNFGDGSAEAIGQNQAHIYSFNGVYTVVMTATGDYCGTPPTATKLITVGSGIAPASIIYLPVMLKNFPTIFPTGNEALETRSVLARNRSPPLVPTLCVGMPAQTLRVSDCTRRRAPW